MIHDIENTAKRLVGFLKKDSTPNFFTMLRWLSVIENDQHKERSARFKSRFEGFSSADKSFLMRYEAEIMILFESGKNGQEILENLMDHFQGVKKFSSVEVLTRFLKRMEVLNG